MAIARFENVDVNNLSFGVDSVGEYTTTITKWFTTRARVQDVKNNLEIDAKYRVYQDLVNLTFNYTPNMKAIVDNQNPERLRCFNSFINLCYFHLLSSKVF